MAKQSRFNQYNEINPNLAQRQKIRLVKKNQMGVSYSMQNNTSIPTSKLNRSGATNPVYLHKTVNFR
ncbi:unnamed protein product [Rotaria sordida]|uniref:Uncharacterized protein n=1 Tax=Rotaria sordida TaxID=392033 RepID=A0A815FRB8_9BILA|nr:unnamed protein product [Rotaria sordida]